MNGYDLVIIGAGPAGLTAGIYAGRDRLRTLILDKENLGGQLVNREAIENYPGYPNGIPGPELGSNMATQAMNLGVEIQFDEVQDIETEARIKQINGKQGLYSAKAIIIASGSRNRKLGVIGEDEFLDKGVFYCATCDGPRFANKVVVVAGGGNSGVTEALSLARYVSRVTLIELQSCLTADKVLQERLARSTNVEVKCGYKIEAIRGDDEVRSVDIVDANTGQKAALAANGILVTIGVIPNTDYLGGRLQLDSRRRIVVDEKMATSVHGVFAAGDVRQNSPMQIATAVGDGVRAALSAEEYLSEMQAAN